MAMTVMVYLVVVTGVLISFLQKNVLLCDARVVTVYMHYFVGPVSQCHV